ncbi:MAG: hypothetical protein ACOYD6_06130 [Limnochordia bacterium]
MRVDIILLVCLLVLGLLFVGQHVLYQRQVLETLEASFQGIVGVQGVQLHQGPDRLQVKIQLAPVDNIKQTYGQLVQVARESLTKENWMLVIEDGRNQFLEDVYYDMHFVVAEGIATGRFATMAQRLETLAETLDGHKFFVDGENVYIHLQKDDAYLYEIVPRLPVTLGGGSTD